MITMDYNFLINNEFKDIIKNLEIITEEILENNEHSN